MVDSVGSGSSAGGRGGGGADSGASASSAAGDAASDTSTSASAAGLGGGGANTGSAANSTSSANDSPTTAESIAASPTTADSLASFATTADNLSKPDDVSVTPTDTSETTEDIQEKEIRKTGMTAADFAKAVAARQQTLTDLKNDALGAKGLNKEVAGIVGSHTFDYINNDDYDFDGTKEFGVNYGTNKVGISSLHWDGAGKLDKAEMVDTFFHEVQHSRAKNNNHTDADFQKEIDAQKNAFNANYGAKWK